MKVSDYAAIGDMRTGALIDRSGSIDWWCVPRFDSASVFARLLGGDAAGFWRLAPETAFRVTRRYRGDSLVLETTFETPDGIARVIDALPLGCECSTIVRIVEGVKGSLALRMRLRARMHYGLLTPWTSQDGGAWTALAAPDALHLRTSVAIAADGTDAIADFRVAEGERVTFTLQWFPAEAAPARIEKPEDLVEATVAWWQQWADRCTYRGNRRELVIRSALALKSLTFQASGATMAAMSTSLPERLGGRWNWDYRFCWLRDSAFATTSLLQVGYAQEAFAWLEWFFRVYAGDPKQLHVMYGAGGERLTPEAKLKWLSGFRDSKPVRVGNDAHDQFQLGIIGDVTRSLVACIGCGYEIDEARWTLLRPLIAHIENVWQCPDYGIWETRGAKHRYVHSIVMAWRAAEDLAVLATERRPADRQRALSLASQIRAEVENVGFNTRVRAFTAYLGGKELDAATLLLPLYDFLPIDDPRITATIAAIERHLTVDGYVFRYSSDLDVKKGRLAECEGAFLLCGFWLVQVYARQGRTELAHALFERLAATANDVGILSEEFDVSEHEAVGNTPQAFSHCGLIDAAVALTALS
jgi:GH15 family glucan-1,4-alpha-glucosidase